MASFLLLLNIGSIEFFFNKVINQLTIQLIFLMAASFFYILLNSYKIYIDKILKIGISYVFIGLISFFYGGKDAYMLGLVLLGLTNGLLMYFVLMQNFKLISSNNFFYSIRIVFYIGSFFGLVSEVLGRFNFVLPISWGYGFCMVLFPLVFYSLRKKRMNNLRIFVRVVPFFILILITSWRAFSLMSIIAVVYSINRQFSILKMMGSGFVGIVLAMTIVLAGSKSSQTDVSSGRIFLWLKTVEIISENNFTGAGFGQFSSYYYKSIEEISKVEVGDIVSEAPGQSKERNHTHNSILQVLFDTGVLGLALFLSIIFALYKNINKLNSNYYLKKNLKISLMVMLSVSMFSSFGGIYSMYFWMIFAVIMNAVRLEVLK